METVTLAVQQRDGVGKNKVKSPKSEGIIPGIVYGLEKANIPVSINRNELMKAFKSPFGPNVVIELDIAAEKGKQTEKVIAYQIDMDHIRHEVIHVDFLRVDDKVPVKVKVPVHLQGNAPGVKMGGTLIKKMDFIFIRALPGNIPTHFDIDISGLGLDDMVNVNGLQLGEGVESLSPENDVIVRVAGKRGKSEEEAEAAEAAEGEGAEGEDSDSDTSESGDA